MSNYYIADKNEIKNIYSRLKSDALRNRVLRKEEVYEKIPRIAKIDEEISLLNIDFIKSRLRNMAKDRSKDSDIERKKKLALLNKEKTTLLKESGYPSDYLLVHYSCPICKDEGFVNGKRCECFNKRLADILYKQSSHADIIKKESFENFSLSYYSHELIAGYKKSPYDNMVDKLEKAKEFTKQFDNRGQNILIYGEAGLGKSFLSHAISKELIESGHSVLYVSANELFSDILSKYLMSYDTDTKLKVEPVYELVYNADLLVIDDLGTEVPNNFTASQVFEVVNQRLIQNRSTIITTNLSVQDLSKAYSERLMSRFVDRYEFFNIFGKDIRYQKKQQAFQNKNK